MSDTNGPLAPRQKKARPIHTFKVPPKLVSGDSPASIGMVEITADEELMAEKRAHGDRGRVAVELTKQAMAEADGKPLQMHDGSAESVWLGLSPKVRTLLITAYTKLHIPSDEETNGFFDSMEVKL